MMREIFTAVTGISLLGALAFPLSPAGAHASGRQSSYSGVQGSLLTIWARPKASHTARHHLRRARQLRRTQRPAQRIRVAARLRPALLPNAGTRILRGTMTSQSTVQMTAAFSVGQAASLDWDLPRPTSLQLNGFQQAVQWVHVAFNVRSASHTDLVVNGHPMRRFHWDNPPANTVIHAVETLRLVTRSSLSPLHTRAAYPLRTVPRGVRPYLQMTPLVRLPGSARALIRSLRTHRANERQVVDNVVNWVASNIHYPTTNANPAYDAGTVLRSREATCRGYTDLTAGMLRALGIPAQVVIGMIAGKPIDLRGTGTTSIGWDVGNATGEMHAWLNVYFPDAGWVPLDPQMEKFFVDTRHLVFERNLDAGETGIGVFTVRPTGDASPTGRNLSNGYVAIAPADGISSKVAVQAQDSMNVQYGGSVRDVRGVLLFSR